MENIHWFPGHMAKALKDIQQSLTLVDLIIEVLDARAPLAGSNPRLRLLAPQKPHFLLLNKTDLADSLITPLWINYWKRRGLETFAVDTRTGQGYAELKKALIVFREELKARQHRPKRPAFRMMVVGVPNTGKSLVINRLSGGKFVPTGDKPGVTRGKQWVTTDFGWEILDTPGVMQPEKTSEEAGFCLAATGSISERLIDTESLSINLFAFLKNKYPERLKAILTGYKDDDSELKLLQMFGKQRGCLLKGGEIDLTRAAGIFWHDFRQGKTGRFTLEQPPTDCP